MRSPALRHVVLAANLAYVTALLMAAYDAYVVAHRPPEGPEADWAAFDALMYLMLTAAIAAYAGAHLIATRRWWVGSGVDWVLATTVPLAGFLTLAWLAITLRVGFGETNDPGWLVIGAAVISATLTQIADRRGQTVSI